MKKNVFALFPSAIAVDNALRDLEEQGYNADDVSLIGQEGILKAHDASETAEDAGKGAGIGGLIGLIAGIAAIPLPGIGPVIGTGTVLSGLFGGAGVGAVTGGIVGALRDMFGGKKDLAEHYDAGLHKGHILLAVNTTAADTHGVEEILERNGGQHLAVQDVRAKERAR